MGGWLLPYISYLPLRSPSVGPSVERGKREKGEWITRTNKVAHRKRVQKLIKDETTRLSHPHDREELILS